MHKEGLETYNDLIILLLFLYGYNKYFNHISRQKRINEYNITYAGVKTSSIVE